MRCNLSKRVSPHINIEASAIQPHRSELAQYEITPKGML